jgi:hypothetical protein
LTALLTFTFPLYLEGSKSVPTVINIFGTSSFFLKLHTFIALQTGYRDEDHVTLIKIS